MEERLQHFEGYSTKMLLESTKRLTNSGSNDKEIQIVGREDDKEEIMRRILPSTEVEGPVPVVAIWGVQGMGKTTLAKFVCDDERIKGNFDLVIWIDGIHEESYAESIVERMIHESASKKKKEKKLELEEKDPIAMDENLNLGEVMSGSRFLLVLDDLQSENREEWLKLQQILREAASSSGGAVLVTTQNSLVASVVDPGALPLGRIFNSWALFEQVVPSELTTTDAQEKMADKCKGVPLAILTMARMLRSREAITASVIDHLEEEFMQEMKLIYYDKLPSCHLKQCFAYLSMISSDAFDSIKAKTLIRLWMAEGFLGPMRLKSDSSSSSCSPQQAQPEDLLLDCIQELCRRSILTVREDKYGILTDCSMPNELMRELSRFVAGKDRFYVDSGDENVRETVHRVAFTDEFDISDWTSKSLFASNKNLRTLLCGERNSRIPNEVKLSRSACNAIFCAFKGLRVLKLANLGIKRLPVSIGEMKRLSYLDLSRNNMKKLPNSIGKLKHLQTIILSHCYQLRELPNEMKHLVSLRHLEMKECLNLTHMPSALKKLTNLQTMTNFVVSTSNKQKHALDFRELGNLNNLRGKLEISHLERLNFMGSEQDGHHAYLKKKQHLKRLVLKWNHDDDNDSNQDQISLGHLEPQPKLEELCIEGYKGTEFSDWVSSLENLGSLILYNCSKCESLPSLEKFPKLKSLQLKRLDSLECITDQDEGCVKLGLELLEDLSISDCPNLSSWWKGRTHKNAILFGSIKQLEVKYCPKLDCMPLFPNLYGGLVLEGSSMEPLLQTITYTSASNSSMLSDSDSISNSSLPLSKLNYLEIKYSEKQSPRQGDCWDFISLSREILISRPLIEGFKHLSSLTSLLIANWRAVDLPNDEWEGLQNLHRLTIEQVIDLESLPEGIKHLTSLTSLYIEGCPELTTLTEGIGHLTSLKWLTINECHKLASLPGEMTNLRSLRFLTIRDCPLLLPRCQKETGDCWPQIQHIDYIWLEDNSEIYE